MTDLSTYPTPSTRRSAPESSLQNDLTRLLRMKYPIMLAGMNVAAGPSLAAAVTNAGGLGVIGGVSYTPKMLRKNIHLLKKELHDPKAPFGVDLLLPQVGGSARKTNYDYTNGQLGALTDVIIEEGATLFVSAVGTPPRWVVDKMHSAGIPVMNMIGAPKHVSKCLAAGVDIICAQGGEGGGHTGDVATSILLPSVVDLCKGHKSPLTGGPVHVVGAGGIFDGRGMAMALCLGVDAVWIGTRFVASVEAGAPKRHKEGVVEAGFHDTVRTLIYTGRPLRIKKTPYVMNWEDNRQDDIKKFCAKGKLPYKDDVERWTEEGKSLSAKEQTELIPLLMGQVAGVINDVLPADQIVFEMVNDCVATLRQLNGRIAKL